ncbi:site-2 protease family protein [Algisphaera agarilytica]|uniref:Regulator of sigma E protease n=1 Tax=Algisphaera agarilytica TaxID=1385975 RepID=A0A7X0LJR4_9BACT|nr:site-2 protease family protein [Algisphaera agarilytica]MBB6428223.1 regulator of sigma E protease [Algisphaera agarilytica]
MMSAIFSNNITAVIALILGFGFLIFVHELGHFAVAKWVGIRATQFAIGFGNAIVSYRKGIGFRAGGTEKEYIARALDALKEEGKSIDGLDEHKRNQMIMEKADELGLGETEYRWNTLPLGGYVKMLGQEDMDPSAQSDDPRSFNRKSIGARAAVISAGVIMNLIFGLIFFIICFQMGVKFPAAVVGGVEMDKPANTTYAEGHEGDPAYRGLEPGDVITHINGKPITDMAEVRIATALGKGGKPVEMTVDREGEAAPLTFNITAVASEANEGLLSAGIVPADTLTVGESRDSDRVGEAAVTKGSVFDGIGIEPGMVVASINSQPVENYGQFHRAFQGLESPQVEIGFGNSAGNAVVMANTLARPSLVRTKVGEDQVRNLLGLRPVTSIPGVSDDKPAKKAGVEPGDQLAQLGSLNWPAVEDIEDVVKGANGEALDIVVQRDGKLVDLGQVQPRRNLIGVNLAPATSLPRVASVIRGSVFDRAATDRPLPPGSRLIAVNDREVANWTEFQHAVSDSLRAEGQPANIELTFAINLGDQQSTETYNLALTETELGTLRETLAWLPPSGFALEPLMTTVKASSPIEATQIGIDKTGQFIQQTYITLLRLIQGTIGVKNLRGPVGIVDEGSKVAKQGMAYYLFFLGLISVNLAVLNFLPIPIVDGGLMVFLMIEKIKGSPASPKVQTAVALVGLVGLACVFLYVTFNDISRIVTG